MGYLDLWNSDFPVGHARAGSHPNRGQEISSPPLLVHDRCLDDGRDNHGRLCNPLIGDRLRRRIIDPVRLPDGGARPLVLVARLHIRYDRQHTKGGSLLLGGDHILPNLRNCSRGLDSRCGPRLRGRGARIRRSDWRCLLRPISGRVCRGSCCSGSRLSSLDRLVPPLAISSTNPSTMAGLHSVVQLSRWSSRSL